LRYFKERSPDSVAVADTHCIVRHSINREIFTELPEGKIVTAQLAFPIPVGIDLVNQNRSVLAAMPGEIALSVTVDIQPPNQAPALDRFLPDTRVHGLAVPRNVTRKSNIYR
jgi:hypothetical protein